MPAPEVRLVLAVSLDGRLAPATGGAAQLGGVGDRRVLEEALAWSDGCLIGANTLRLHGCTCLIRDVDLLEQREQQGRSAQPVAVVLSRVLDWDQGLRFFKQPLQRWLAAVNPGDQEVRPDDAAGFDCVLPAQLTWQALLDELACAGLERLVLLGGAGLCGSLLAEDLVDQLQLTITPHLLGGPHTWVPMDCTVPLCIDPNRGWSLKSVRQLSASEVVLHYQRRQSS